MKKMILFVLAFSTVVAQADSDLSKKALNLLLKLEVSGYGVRSLCISGQKVVGVVPGAHWSEPNSIARGTLTDFPKSIEIQKDVPFKLDYPTGPSDWGRFEVLKRDGSAIFYKTTGKVGNTPADVCVFESKPVLE